MAVKDDKKKGISEAGREKRPASLSRRTLLRRGLTAMPAVLTLQSGAALARSSNLISAAPRGTTDRLGRTLCLDTTSVRSAGSRPGVYDVGRNRRSVVNVIRDRKYYVSNPNQHDQYDRYWGSQESDWRDRDWRDRDSKRTEDGDGNDYGEQATDIEYVDAGRVCQTGGKFWVKPRFSDSYRMVELKGNGVVLSTGAVLSMSDGLTGKLI